MAFGHLKVAFGRALQALTMFFTEPHSVGLSIDATMGGGAPPGDVDELISVNFMPGSTSLTVHILHARDNKIFNTTFYLSVTQLF